MFLPLDPFEVSAALASRPDIGSGLQGMFAHFNQVFELKSPAAPGIRIVGGVVQVGPRALEQRGMSYSVSGNGWTLADALVSLLGEAAELLSQFEQADDLCSTDESSKLNEGWIHSLSKTATGPIRQMAGINLVDGLAVLLPADLVLRRSQGRRMLQPVGALSSGVAAGPSKSAAIERAILELVERDAAALWWLGGKRGIALAGSESDTAAILLDRMRKGDISRTTQLLDITTDIGIPVVAAKRL
jgi:ribosomal protein S12 methylthiotransferase accessory factor YcaO